MPVPHISTNFGDLLDPRFQRIFNDRFNQLPDMIPIIFTMPPDNGRADMRWSQTSGYTDWSTFTGTVIYQSASQGFDTTATHVEFASGIQVERKLFDDDQYNIMDQRPPGSGDGCTAKTPEGCLRHFHQCVLGRHDLLQQFRRCGDVLQFAHHDHRGVHGKRV